MIVTLNSVDVTADVLISSFSVVQRAFNRSDTFSFDVRKRGALGFVPAGNQTITITHNGTTLYNGTTLRVRARQLTYNEVIYTVECKSREHFLNRKVVTERKENMTVNAIIAELFADYASGFTTTGVDADVLIETIAFNKLTLTECLDKLARLLNYQWYLDVDDDLHFFAKNTEVAPFSLSDTNGNYLQGTLELTSDYSQIRNVITVKGGEAVGETRTEKKAGDGETDTFPLANKFDTLPTVTVDGVAVTVGVDFLQNEENYDVMWNRNQKYLRFTTGNIPAAPISGTTNIDVTGNPVYSINVRYLDAASIGEFGEFEHFVKDTNIESRKEALDRAIAELDAYKQEVVEGSFETYTDGLRAGQVINVTSALLGISEDYVIQEVTITLESVDRPLYRVSLATLRTMGIVDVLQRQVFGEQLREGEDETLQSFQTLTDTFAVTDSAPVLLKTSPPYIWGDLWDGLVSYWKLDEASGTRVDSCGANDLSDPTSVAGAAGVISNGADFEKDSTQYLSITDAAQSGLDFEQSFSFAFFLKPETLPGYAQTRTIIGKRDTAPDISYAINLYSDGGALRVVLSEDGSTAYTYTFATNIVAGEWCHIAVVFDAVVAGGVAVYKDGTQVSNTIASSVGSINNGAAPFVIGAAYSGGSPTTVFDGIVDEVAAFSRPITPYEVAVLCNGGTGNTYGEALTGDYPQMIWDFFTWA